MNKEAEWDKKLKISTCGRDDSKEDSMHYPYEPTPYCVLERFAESGYLGKGNRLIDYGCGKGRVAIFLNHETGCAATGVDFDSRMIDAAEENLTHTSVNTRQSVSFVCEDASMFDPGDADSFYFFNPFSEQILRSVLGTIVAKSYERDDQFLLFFYYPDEETVSLLMTESELTFEDEIDMSDQFPGNNEREKILVFSVD